MKTIIGRLYSACCYAIIGLKFAVKNELAVRLELALLIMATPIAFWLGQTPVEKLLLFSSALLILLMEIINTAIEAIIDRVGHERHVLSAAAKDLGSLIVLLAIVNAVVIWGYILFARVFT